MSDSLWCKAGHSGLSSILPDLTHPTLEGIERIADRWSQFMMKRALLDR